MAGPMYEGAADLAAQDYGRQMSAGQMLAVAGSSLVAMFAGIAGDLVPQTAVSAADAAALQCKNPEAPGYNTIICLRSPQQTETECESAALQKPHPFREGYATNSKSDYKISFGEPEMTGCAPAGTRKFTVSQEARDGSAGTFEESSNIVTIMAPKGGKPVNASEGVTAPYNCAVDTAGSAVRAVLKITWVPNKKFDPHAKDSVQTYYGKSQAIC
jgi:hypothetical protein